MYRFFDPNGSLISPYIFDKGHLTALFIIGMILLSFFLFRNSLRKPHINKSIRYIMGTLMLLNQISFHVWAIIVGNWSLQLNLPLQICTIAAYSCAYLLFTKEQKVFNIMYFLVMTATVQATLTPDTGYGYDHYYFYCYFISHGLSVLSILFMIIVEKYRVTFDCIKKSFVFVNILAAITLFFNWILGANYMYLMKKPPSDTLMSFLGPWPFYIIVEEILAILLFSLAYLPFALTKKKEKKEIPLFQEK